MAKALKAALVTPPTLTDTGHCYKMLFQIAQTQVTKATDGRTSAAATDRRYKWHRWHRWLQPLAGLVILPTVAKWLLRL